MAAVRSFCGRNLQAGKSLICSEQKHTYLNSCNAVKVQRLVDAMFKSTEGVAEIDAGELNIILQVLYATGKVLMNECICVSIDSIFALCCMYVCLYISCGESHFYSHVCHRD